MSRHTRADDRRQPSAEVLDVARVGAAEPQPGFLHRVVRLGRRAEHPVGDRPQVGPVRLEALGQSQSCSSIGHIPCRDPSEHDERNPVRCDEKIGTLHERRYQDGHLPGARRRPAKTLYGALLGVEPSTDQPYYVGFQVGDQEIGLDPNGHHEGAAGPVAYWHVDDIEQSLQSVLDAGAEVEQAVKDVGGGKLTAMAKDADGNVIGLIQEP